MAHQFVLNIVTGAPGSGKSVSARGCAQSQAEYVAFDMDCLLESASALARKDIHFAQETWPAYNAVWMDVMEAVLRNGTSAVLFAPISPRDLLQLPPWCDRVRFLLLDCVNDGLRQRLADRQWPEARIHDAIEDANELRTCGIGAVIRTDKLEVAAIVDAISSWQRES
jgi:broad-specificity NMP kinase